MTTGSVSRPAWKGPARLRPNQVTPGSNRRQAELACTPSPTAEADSCAAVTRRDREVNGNRLIALNPDRVGVPTSGHRTG